METRGTIPISIFCVKGPSILIWPKAVTYMDLLPCNGAIWFYGITMLNFDIGEFCTFEYLISICTVCNVQSILICTRKIYRTRPFLQFYTYRYLSVKLKAMYWIYIDILVKQQMVSFRTSDLISSTLKHNLGLMTRLILSFHKLIVFPTVENTVKLLKLIFKIYSISKI